jgi:aryl-alcohol dehydrogenase-like predicted oxidoreductase
METMGFWTTRLGDCTHAWRQRYRRRLGHHRAQGAIDTVPMAVDAGVTMPDLAPIYSLEHEAEVVAGEALRNRSAAEVMITTEVELDNDQEVPPALVSTALSSQDGPTLEKADSLPAGSP